MNKKHSVLLDLSIGHVTRGHSGIPKDSRLLFATLSHSCKLNLAGMLMSYSIMTKYSRPDSLLDQSIFFGFHLNGLELKTQLSSHFKKLHYFLDKIKKIKQATKSKHELFNLNENLDFDIIWRSFFKDTIPFSEYKLLSQMSYALTDMSLQRMSQSFIPAKLKTDNIDFIITQCARKIKTSKNTTHIVRYHDCIPIFLSDTVNSSKVTIDHYKSVKFCEKNSIFVCNSPSAKNDLHKISEIAGEKAHVIPYVLPQMHRQYVEHNRLAEIAATYISTTTLGQNHPDKVIERWLHQKSNENKIPKFIMTLSTIEPRKNHINLIEAWQKLRLLTNDDIKLLVVGSPGWNFLPILEAMKPYVSSGKLLHLEKVPEDKLPYLYSAALCFIFPSYGEGFGLPPCEAMQCECPVAVSDIASHRFASGEGALYFSPYNTDEIANTILQLIYNENLRINLIRNGLNNVQRFTRNVAIPQWENLFDNLAHERRK